MFSELLGYDTGLRGLVDRPKWGIWNAKMGYLAESGNGWRPIRSTAITRLASFSDDIQMERESMDELRPRGCLGSDRERAEAGRV